MYFVILVAKWNRNNYKLLKRRDFCLTWNSPSILKQASICIKNSCPIVDVRLFRLIYLNFIYFDNLFIASNLYYLVEPLFILTILILRQVRKSFRVSLIVRSKTSNLNHKYWEFNISHTCKIEYTSRYKLIRLASDTLPFFLFFINYSPPLRWHYPLSRGTNYKNRANFCE